MDLYRFVKSNEAKLVGVFYLLSSKIFIIKIGHYHSNIYHQILVIKWSETLLVLIFNISQIANFKQTTVLLTDIVKRGNIVCSC